MNDKSLPIKHKIKEPGFSYHVLKGVLEKGSSISKNKHPVPEVEYLKNQLIKKGKLVDKGKAFILNSPVKTGLLMALNLNAGYLIKEYETDKKIVVSESEAKILRETLPQGNIQLSNSEIVLRTDKYSYKFKNLFDIEFNDAFLKNHSSDCFGSDEKYVVDVLKESGILTDNARHGISRDSEADIVDETNNLQFEVTYERRIIPKHKKREKDVLFDTEFQAVRVVNNNPFLLVSGSTIEKFTSKIYTEKYKLVIAILCIGTRETAKSLIGQLSKQLKKEGEINNVSGIVLISIDYISDKTYVVSSIGGAFFEKSLDMIPLDFYRKKAIQLCEMNEFKTYTMLCKNIFNGHEMLFSGSKEEINALTQNLSVFKYD